LLRKLGGILGLLQDNPEDFLKISAPASLVTESASISATAQVITLDERIAELIARREQARREKNWAEADRIRDILKAEGIVLEDRADGTSDWRLESH